MDVRNFFQNYLQKKAPPSPPDHNLRIFAVTLLVTTVLAALFYTWIHRKFLKQIPSHLYDKGTTSPHTFFSKDAHTTMAPDPPSEGSRPNQVNNIFKQNQIMAQHFLQKVPVPGLIAILIRDYQAAVLEVNCEKESSVEEGRFQDGVEDIAHACLDHVRLYSNQGLSVSKICIESNQYNSVKDRIGHSIAHHLDNLCSAYNEKIVLVRAVTYKRSPNVRFYSYTYPPLKRNELMFGRLGSLVALQGFGDDIGRSNLDEFGMKMALHVSAAAPKYIDSDFEVAEANVDNYLYRQSYVLDTGLKVKDVLLAHGVNVVNFCRFECGETSAIMG